MALADRWDTLAEAAGNPFVTREWTETWWRHFGRGERWTVACRDSDGRLVAVCPLYRATGRPLRVLRFVGHGPADELGPACARPDLPAAARALGELLAGRDDWDVLLAERLPGGEAWAERLGARPVRREPGPVLELAGEGWEAYLGRRSANFRGQVRGKERRLARQGRLNYRLCRDPDRLDRDFDALVALHAGRWAHGTSRAFAGGRAAFHRDLARQMLERGWLRLWIVEVDDVPVAAWHGFRVGGVEWYYQAGRDPAWDRWSVGFVLLAHTVREAAKDGVRAYRFGLGAEEYKRRFADADPGTETFAMARGPAGALATAAGARLVRRQVPGRVRAVVRRAAQP